MIERVIDTINTGITDLKIFKVINGLCEMIEEPFDVGESKEIAKFPALYKGKDHLKYVAQGLDYKQGVVFHLPNGNQGENILEQLRIGQRRVERTWPLKIISICRRDVYRTDDAYSAIEVLNNCQNIVSKLNIIALRFDLGVEKVLVNVNNSSYDRSAILAETFENIEFKAPHDLVVAKIEYEIIISGAEQCFINYSC